MPDQKTTANFKLTALPIGGAWLVEPIRKADARGYFARIFCIDEFAELGLETAFVQRSVSFNVRKHTLRGLHFQEGKSAETKLVRCTRGAIFDVIIDLRGQAPTYLKQACVELRPETGTMLYIPPGCAHGFLTLEEASEVAYEITPRFDPAASAGIRWNDSALAVPWPATPAVVGERDMQLPTLLEYLANRKGQPAPTRRAGPFQRS